MRAEDLHVLYKVFQRINLLRGSFSNIKFKCENSPIFLNRNFKHILFRLNDEHARIPASIKGRELRSNS